jgi:hypothetical protein
VFGGTILILNLYNPVGGQAGERYRTLLQATNLVVWNAQHGPRMCLSILRRFGGIRFVQRGGTIAKDRFCGLDLYQGSVSQESLEMRDRPLCNIGRGPRASDGRDFVGKERHFRLASPFHLRRHGQG